MKLGDGYVGVDFTTIRYFCSSMNEDFLSKCFQIVLLIELAKSETHTHTHTLSLQCWGSECGWYGWSLVEWHPPQDFSLVGQSRGGGG